MGLHILTQEYQHSNPCTEICNSCSNVFFHVRADYWPIQMKVLMILPGRTDEGGVGPGVAVRALDLLSPSHAELPSQQCWCSHGSWSVMSSSTAAPLLVTWDVGC